jgi:LacI family transcriptional regulator, galactose operon repressor
MRAPEPPTAIFAANDLMAIGVLRAAGELGRRGPGDLAVVGFDDIELASYTTPPLTTVSQSANEVGRAAVELLLERLADPARPRAPDARDPVGRAGLLRQPAVNRPRRETR